jgi:hypothetical protein
VCAVRGSIIDPLETHHAHIEDEQRLNLVFERDSRGVAEAGRESMPALDLSSLPPSSSWSISARHKFSFALQVRVLERLQYRSVKWSMDFGSNSGRRPVLVHALHEQVGDPVREVQVVGATRGVA